MKWVSLFVLLFSLFLFSGCAEIKPRPPKEFQSVNDTIIKKYFYTNTTLKNPSENITERVLKEIHPIAVKGLNPLEKRISISFENLDYKKLFYYIASQTGLNLVIDPSVDDFVPKEKKNLTFTFKNFALKDVINTICTTLDIYCYIQKDVLYVKPFEEKFFRLNFIPLVRAGNMNLGGDVLGGTKGSEITNPLTGEFKISSSFAKGSSDIYAQLETNIKSMLSKDGIFQLNSALGILYVKDRPSYVKTVESYIKDLEKRYMKQVLLDVKIIEVSLNKNVQTGINWFSLSNFLLGKNRISFSSLTGTINTEDISSPFSLTIQGTPNINAILKFLGQYGKVNILSNPKIRVLHGQPALISVGTSISYIKSIEISNDTFTVTPSSIFEGILLGITPYITNNNTVILQIIPIKSDLQDMRSVSLRGGSYYINLPTVNLREMSTIIKTRPGDLVIIGGLILKKKQKKANRLELPILNKIFNTKTEENSKTELVILINVKVD